MDLRSLFSREVEQVYCRVLIPKNISKEMHRWILAEFKL